MSDIVKEALQKAEHAKDYWADAYRKAGEDIDFISDEPGAQWDSRDFDSRKRKNRPALTVDQLTQFVNQVSNDIRMNTPTINVIPHSGGADIETAEVYQGLTRDIEQDSSADDAYDYAVNMAVKCGIGFFRIDHKYAYDDSFDQKLCIERVVNSFSVLLDPASINPDGSDAKFAFVFDEVSEEEFKENWPGKNPVSFDSDDDTDSGEDDKKITIAEYFRIDEEDYTLAQLADGTTAEYADGMDAIATRPATRRIVRRYKLSGQDVLEEGTFPGKYIPLIPVYGEEAWNGGKRHLHSLIRKAKDPQRRYNYWCSVEAELLMKSPKSTIIAVGGTTEQYAQDYKDPDNAIVLRYDQTDAKGNPAPPPQMNPGPQIPAGIVNAMRQAADDIKATMGLYNSFLGQRSNETSGVAIQQRKMEGDRAIYHYGDNLTRAITHCGRVLVSAIPEIYNTPRIVRIVGKEDESTEIGINGMMAEGQERPFDLAKGQYSVKVTTGASFATMRQEAAEFFQQVIQSQPQLMEVAGDLMFKYMDFPGAQALSERMKKIMNPQFFDDDGQDPQVMALQQQNQQLQQAMQQLQGEAQVIQQQLQDKQAEIQIKAQETALDAQEGQQKQAIEIQKLRLEEQKMQAEYEIKQAEIMLKERELDLKEAEAIIASQGRMNGAEQGIPQSGGV